MLLLKPPPEEGVEVHVKLVYVFPVAVRLTLPTRQKLVAPPAVIVTTGAGVIVTVTCDRGPSQPAADVSDTQYDVLAVVDAIYVPLPVCMYHQHP